MLIKNRLTEKWWKNWHVCEVKILLSYLSHVLARSAAMKRWWRNQMNQHKFWFGVESLWITLRDQSRISHYGNGDLIGYKTADSWVRMGITLSIEFLWCSLYCCCFNLHFIFVILNGSLKISDSCKSVVPRQLDRV